MPAEPNPDPTDRPTNADTPGGCDPGRPLDTAPVAAPDDPATPPSRGSDNPGATDSVAGRAPEEASSRLQLVALAGGIGGARFLRGLLAHLDRSGTAADVTVIGNTGDDVTLHGLRVCPDLDTVMYTLGGGIHEGQGWGRDGETFSAAEELAAYGRGPAWFTLGDRDLATHVVRTELLRSGMRLSGVTALLCERWRPGVRLLPMSDDVVETHVDLEDGRVVHFQEWWVGLHAAVPARRIVPVGAAEAKPAPGVVEAIQTADVVLLPPSNPVVSIGTILAVPGVRDALRDTPAPVVGVSPIIGGAPVRGMADACLTTIGLETSARAVAGLYAGFLDSWLVAAGDGWSSDALRVVERPLLMSDLDAAAQLAGAALAEGLAIAAADR